MSGYEAKFDRRVQQFHEYLKPMYGRSRNLEEFCFIVFEEDSTDEERLVHRNAAKASPRTAAVGISVGPGVFAPEEIGLLDALDAELDEEYPWRRYVQIGFDEDYFFIDMPVESISGGKAWEIIAARQGFRHAGDNPLTPTTAKDIKDFDPLQKFYLYGEEKEAAVDVASIFFDIWGLTTDTRLYVSSHSRSGRSWERGESFE